MERYIKEAAEVAFVLLIATLTYDFLSTSCFNKSYTYRCFKTIRNSKSCKRFLKRFKKRRKPCDCKCSTWPTCDTPLKNAEVVNQTSLPFVKFGSSWPDLKSDALPLLQELLACFEEKFTTLQLLTSMIVENCIRLAEDSVKNFSTHIQEYGWVVTKYTAKILRHY